MGPFVITRCFINGAANLQCGAIKIKYNMCRIKPYKYDAEVEDSSSKVFTIMSTYELPVIYLCLKPNLGTKYTIGYSWGN